MFIDIFILIFPKPIEYTKFSLSRYLLHLFYIAVIVDIYATFQSHVLVISDYHRLYEWMMCKLCIFGRYEAILIYYQHLAKTKIIHKAIFKWVNMFPSPDCIHLGLVKVKLLWTKKTLRWLQYKRDLKSPWDKRRGIF